MLSEFFLGPAENIVVKISNINMRKSVYIIQYADKREAATVLQQHTDQP